MNLELYFIINPHAGGGKAKKITNEIFTLCQEKKLSYQAFQTRHPEHAISLTLELVDKYLAPWSADWQEQEQPFPLLIVIGGDGTLHEVVNTLGESHMSIPVAYIPAGSGNDFARGNGIAKNVRQAFEHILTVKEPRNFTLLQYQEGIAEETGFILNNFGIGLDAAVVAATNKSHTKERLNKFNFGALSYFPAIIKTIFKQKGFPISIQANGQEFSFNQAFLCTVMDHPYLGGGIKLSPQSSSQEANMDLMIVERIPLRKIFYLIYLLMRQKHLTSKHLHVINSQEIRIISLSSQSGQVDGETLGERPYEVTFKPIQRLFWL